jgi:hypothetical protein
LRRRREALEQRQNNTNISNKIMIGADILDIGTRKYDERVNGTDSAFTLDGLSAAPSSFMLPTAKNPAEFVRANFNAEKKGKEGGEGSLRLSLGQSRPYSHINVYPLPSLLASFSASSL